MKDEINLLPPPAAAARRRRILNNRIGQMQRLTIVALLILAASLAGVHAITIINQKLLADEINNVANSLNGTAEEVEAINQTLQAMNSWTSSHEDVSPLLTDVLKSMPAGIKLQSLTLEEQSNGLVISGTFSSRPDVITYQQKLEQLPWVTKIEAPFRNFTTGSDEGFTFTLYRHEQL